MTFWLALFYAIVTLCFTVVLHESLHRVERHRKSVDEFRDEVCKYVGSLQRDVERLHQEISARFAGMSLKEESTKIDGLQNNLEALRNDVSNAFSRLIELVGDVSEEAASYRKIRETVLQEMESHGSR